MPFTFSSYLPLGATYPGYVVFGRVLSASGKAATPSVTVIVEREALDGTRSPLGSAVTDSGDGSYSISYDPDAESCALQLIRVSMEGVSDPQARLIVAPTANERVDFQLGLALATGKAPLYDAVKSRLEQVLCKGQLIEQLDGPATARLAVAAGVEPKEAAIARDAALSASISALPAALFYAAARGGLTAVVSELVKHPGPAREKAVRNAIAEGALSPADEAAALDALDGLAELAIESAKMVGETIATPGLALSLAGVAASDRASVLEAWANWSGTTDLFWDELVLPSGSKTDLEYALHLDEITRGNAPLIQHLWDNYDSLVDLVALKPSDWEAKVAEYPAPASVQKAGNDAAKYANAIFVAVEDKFPTRMLQARSAWFASGTALASFLAGTPSYDINKKSLGALLHDHPEAIAAAGDAAAQAAVAAELPALERLLRIAPRGSRFEVLRDLRAAGITSATQIQLMGRARFMTAAASLGAKAAVVFRRAVSQNALALMVQSGIGGLGSGPNMAVMPIKRDNPLEGTSSPVTWERLFGGRTFCSCEECQSAHGPAAYLADLLFWLHASDSDVDLTGPLLDRRPDIGTLQLSCPNTNTALPAIDLILEQLEALVAPSGTTLSDLQSTRDAAELTARPEHVNEAAYERLAGRGADPVVYPFEQPYVAPLDQSRTLLRALGVDRFTLLAGLRNEGAAAALDEPEIAAELLGMTRSSWSILTGETTASVAARWGLESSLFRGGRGWSTPTGGTVTYLDEPLDPTGGKGAVRIAATSGGASTFSSETYRGGVLRGSLWVAAESTSTIIEVAVGADGAFETNKTFTFDAWSTTPTGGAVSGGSVLAIETPTLDSGWWRVSFTFSGPDSASSLDVRLKLTVTGAVTVYGPVATSVKKPYMVGSTPTTWTTDSLKGVERFLVQASNRSSEHPMSYAELEDLLCSGYVQQTGTGHVSIEFPDLTCDIAGATLHAVDFDGRLDRISRILRLSRDLGWTIRDVDRAILELRDSNDLNLDAELLTSLAYIRSLQRLFGLEASQILDWWAPLDTRRWLQRLQTSETPATRSRIFDADTANAGGPEAEPSPFQRLALALPATRLASERVDLFELDDDGELTHRDQKVADHVSGVAALLGVQPKELAPLVDELTADAELNLANLSALNRHVALAHALRVSIDELIELRRWLWTESGPLELEFPFRSPKDTADFVAELRRNASTQLPQAALRQILGVPGKPRDLSVLRLPSTVEALLALADEVRSQDTAPRAGAVVDLAAPNLLVEAWTGTITPTAAIDPSGSSSSAVKLTDVAEPAALAFATRLLAGSGTTDAVAGDLYLKKVPGAHYFTEIVLVRSGTHPSTHHLAIHPATGAYRVQSGIIEDVVVRDAGEWWELSYRHHPPAGETSTLTELRIYPAAGSDAAAAESIWPTASATVGDATVHALLLIDESPAAARQRALIRKVASLLSADPRLVASLLGSLEYDDTTYALERLEGVAMDVADLRSATPSASADPAVIAARAHADVWELISIAVWIWRAFALVADDVPWLLRQSGTPGFRVENIVRGENVPARYSAWAALREAARLQQVTIEGHLFDLFGDWTRMAATGDSVESKLAAVREGLAARTKWSDADLRTVVGDHDDYGPIFAGAPVLSVAALADPARFLRLATWLELARGIGVSAATVAAWGAPTWPTSTGEPMDAYEAQASEVEHALRGAWGRDRWLAEIPRVREDLRDRQRRGLLSRIVGDPSFRRFDSPDSVGEHLLMDVFLGPCVKTSRVKDAIRTVQVFVERVLIGAEPGHHMDRSQAQEWVWRKNFRVWEANRKVFLYPENWIRPELRKDKTPFFEALESDIAQGDLRPELVEDAYRSYLRKLTDVSKLDTLAMLDEPSDAGTTYHVFARSRAIPYTYWHRTRVEGGRWTPWTEIQRVEGTHLLPTVYQRRVILFWLNISETAAQPAKTPVPSLGTNVSSPQKFFLIRLSWSELRDGRWSTPLKSDAFIGIDENGHSPPGTDLHNLQSTSGSNRYSPDLLHGEVTLDADRSDLIVHVYRATGNQRSSWQVGGFRVNAADWAISFEPPPPLSFTPPFPLTPFVDPPYGYVSQAQKLQRTGAKDRIVDLQAPFSHPTSAGSIYTTILARPDQSPQDWAQITPLRRVPFDPRQPFVFSDYAGSYWVTFDPSYPSQKPSVTWTKAGGPPDLSYVYPSSDEKGPLTLISVADSAKGPFRSKNDFGPDGLVTDDEKIAATEKQSGNVLALNGGDVDRSTKSSVINSNVVIVRSDGSPDVLQSGMKSGPDEIVTVTKAYHAGKVSDETSSITEGTVLLRIIDPKWKFETFFHPHVRAMRQALNELGVFGLIDPPFDPEGPRPLDGQDPSPDSTLDERYELRAVSQPLPADDLDFSAGGAYAQYNWELFFHAPFLIASRLHEAGKFDEAIQWLKLIFDPFRPAQVGEEGNEAARSFWRFRPFREQFFDGSDAPRNIQQLVALLTGDASDPTATAAAQDLLRQVLDWRQNPFDAHAIARTRPIAYMTAVVMKFLDVLIDWGDQLFAQDTLESVGQAAEYYLLAARLLGPRPEQIEVERTTVDTFDQLLAKFEGGVGPNETVEENLRVEAWELLESGAPDEAGSIATLLYFCVPANPELASRYWDRVADRLFKLRNCLDIQGNRRELELFEPPIDPDLLVRAGAAGADLQSLLADVVAGRVPHRRYLAMAELAAGLAAGAQGLGQALLVAIEKRDADQLATLRNTHERRLQEDAIAARTDQIADLEQQLVALQRAREGTELRLKYYRDRPRTNAREEAHLSRSMVARDMFFAAGSLSTAASYVSLIPELDLGTAGGGGSPKVTLQFGGRALAGVLSAVARGLETGAGVAERDGGRLLTQSGYDRRKEEWDFQAATAQKDLDGTDARIASMQIQLAMARKALATASLRLGQIDEIQDVLERRFARDELYDWMASQLSGLHYQSYQLAFEFAKKAEKAWQYELGRNDSFIQFGYWDSGRRGLLAADRLGHDLRRMQVAYSELSTRRLEIEQTFSLREIDPVALLRLQQSGSTEVSLPEELFDLYYPGHYRRRVRAVRLSVAVDAPPNSNVPVELRLARHWIRKDATGALTEGGYGTPPAALVCTSTAQRDGGVFEMSFNGPRLLPFEGVGAVSRWELKLPKTQELMPFAYAGIQDVSLHVAYDADTDGRLRGVLEGTGEDGPTLFDKLLGADKTYARRRLISLKNEHEDVWRRFVDAARGKTPLSVSFKLRKSDLPTYARAATTEISAPELVLQSAVAVPTLTVLGAAITWAGGAWAPDGTGVERTRAGAWTTVPSAWPTSAGDLATPLTVTIGVADETAWGTFTLPDDESTFDILFSMELSSP